MPSIVHQFVQLAEVKGKYDNMFKVEKKDMTAVIDKMLQIVQLGQGESSETGGKSDKSATASSVGAASIRSTSPGNSQIPSEAPESSETPV